MQRVLDAKPGMTPFGLHVLVGQSHTSFIADTTVTERPSAEQLADIAVHTAQVARRMGHEPRVAFLSYSNFGDPEGTYLERIREGGYAYEIEVRCVECDEAMCPVCAAWVERRSYCRGCADQAASPPRRKSTRSAP